LYLGVELEVDGFNTDSRAVHVTDKVDELIGQYAVCVSDGSLSNGFEIVFDPMTLGAFALIRPLIEQVMQYISDQGGHGHDSRNCGLHVHVSRAALGTTDDAKNLACGKLLELTERYQSEISAIARRDIQYSNWCYPTGYGHSTTDSSRAVRRKAGRIQDSQGIGCHDGRRYHVWNFQNTNTIECRAFRSTLKVSTFYATLAFVDTFVRFCTLKTTPEVHEVDSLARVISWGTANCTSTVRECFSNLADYWDNCLCRVSAYTAYAA
jgi:hypothetical protein